MVKILWTPAVGDNCLVNCKDSFDLFFVHSFITPVDSLGEKFNEDSIELFDYRNKRLLK